MFTLRFVLLALFLRTLVPTGTMAAPLSEGWPLQICPSGMAAQSYQALLGTEREVLPRADHAHHGEHAQHDSIDADSACALNPGFAAIVQEPVIQLFAVRTGRLLSTPAVRVRLPRAPPTANRTRAPPEAP